jgi:multiple sugar transport system substrate-binding protein
MQAVIAAWANLEDPHKSAMVGQVGTVIDPAPVGGTHGVVSGDWTLVVPKNLPPERQKAALAFLSWFIGKDVQRAYAEAGGLPVRSDVLTELASQPKFFWMTAYNESEKVAKQALGYIEAPQVEQVLGLRLNQAVIGELSPAAALNKATQEIHDIFVRTGRKTGLLPPLPE